MPSAPPKISIILPNYNYAGYLDRRIQSLLQQTRTDFELIILDDASTDSSREVIVRYAQDSRVSLHFFEENSGRTYARWSDGARMARGEYLLFAGADDDCEPGLLERLGDILDGHPNVGIAYCQSWVIDEKGERIGSGLDFLEGEKFARVDKTRWMQDYIADGQEECGRYLICQNTIPNASGALLRRSVYEAVGGLDVSLRLAADWLLFARMLARSDIAFVAEPLNSFRLHTQSVTANTRRSGLEAEENYRVVAEILQNVRVDRRTEDRVLLALLDNWLRPALHGLSGISLNQHRKIYDLARKADRRLHRRMVRRARDTVRYRARKLIGNPKTATANSQNYASHDHA
jgi:glycosyltransferase involved in cell wall biosynthesis